MAALLGAVSDSLGARFGLCGVRGEVAGWTRAASGHCYFQLKDDSGAASLRCVMFRRAADALAVRPRDGMTVEVVGRLSLYEPRGELQLVVDALQLTGAGSLYEQFLRLKARLEAEGLFDAARKRPAAAHPRALGIVTSLAAAALHDVLTALRRRAPHVPVVLYPCSVQGADAPAQIEAALARAAARQEVSTVILCRGGGSLEDLWAFNDERVVRAVAHSPIPVICGVGHETDFTLADFAADLRAPTPTAAAELSAAPRQHLLDALDAFAATMSDRVAGRLEQAEQRLDRVALHLLRPAQILSRRRRELDGLDARCRSAGRGVMLRQHQHLQRLSMRGAAAWQRRIDRQHMDQQALAARLRALDPRRVLERGFAWLSARSGGAPITSVQQLAPGTALTATLVDGHADLAVQACHPTSPKARATGQD